MNVIEAIKHLTDLKNQGYGDSKIRVYSDYASEFYPEATIMLRLAKDNDGDYGESYGDWVEFR